MVATTQDLTGLAAGTYTVTIVESNSCAITGTVAYTVAAAPAVLASSSTQTNVLCNGASTGAIDLTVTGGTTAYGYSWHNGSTVVSTSADPSGLAAGTYTCTVTDARLCTTTEAVTITETDEVQASGTVTEITCFGLTNGAIDLTVTGGGGAYTYVWSNGATTADLTGLAAGNYYVVIV